jgi:hypothetical protein
MAAPHVAGVAALVIAAEISDVKTRLQETADDLGDAGWDPKYGYGLVDADEAAGATPPPSNDPPTVSITSPTEGSIFDSGATISFTGTASDTEGVDLTASLVWTSNIDIDGQIGTGGSFSATLSDGDHTITAEVTDSGNKTGSASIGITVGTLITKNMHVFSIVMSFDEPTTAGPNKFYTARATVKIVDTDDDDVAVKGATVYGHWSGATSDSDSGVTDASGQVSLVSNKVKNPPDGTTFTFTVDDVIKDGYTPLIDVGESGDIIFLQE